MSATCPNCGHEFEVRVTVDAKAVAGYLAAFAPRDDEGDA